MVKVSIRPVIIIYSMIVRNLTMFTLGMIGNQIDSADPCVIIGTETWLNSRIHSSEIFPSNYEVIRRDREDGYGGVLLAIRKDYIFEKLDIDVKTESVFAKVTLDKNRT